MSQEKARAWGLGGLYGEPPGILTFPRTANASSPVPKSRSCDTAMSLQLEWLGIAEGAVFDARKALTLVGINQDIVRVSSLPTQWQTTIIVLAADDSEEATD